MTDAFALDDAREITRRAHRGQTDRLGVDYMHHVEAVAAGLVDFDMDIQIAGMLHDVVEDCADIGLDDLRSAGVPERAVVAVELVSRNLHPELDYLDAIDLVCTSADATLVKLSDSAHNSLPERVEALSARTGQPVNARYAAARLKLLAAAPTDDAKMILSRANPSLLE